MTTTTTYRYFASVGLDSYDGEPALFIYSHGEGSPDDTVTESMAEWEDRTLGALEASIRDAGFAFVGEWEIDTDGDLIREVRPVE